MSRIEIPTLLFWENSNHWYGSLGNTRFFIQPEVLEGAEKKRLSVQVWKGPLSMDLSEIIATAAFPVTDEGLAQIATWLEERAAEIH